MSTYIGLIGTNGAGKSEVCRYLSEKGYRVVSLSDLVREELRIRGLSEDRDTLTAVANEMKNEYGQDVLAKRTWEWASLQNTPVVFDSIRNAAECDFLKGRGVRMIGIDADIQVRFDRISQRKRASDLVNFETFRRQDQEENEGLSSGQHIFLALKSCDHVMKNNGDLASLHQSVEALLSGMINNGHD